ncbi:alanine racemase [Helicobacter sp. MIT 00-7814]|uniref:alanine racemase n=1 Tax=unclassified Helicobacter TaxID=2593540 RepID=UPI000E1E9515|nr:MULTISPECIES: alanine racemase [unclassified Helicobacter]RDU51671.1 alanine racemase [Helicobacter sp. MIT 00-7814]RDU52382.1 alanine racemase [Helicobacter sp. MIT 99-10781]
MAEILLDSHAFKHNLSIIAQVLGAREKIALVLKDNAYGHGLLEMAHLAKQNGIKNVFVKNHNEALQIAHLFESISIFYGGVNLKQTLQPNMAIVVSDMHMLEGLKSGDKIELKLNVGMNRNGIQPSELEKFFTLIVEKNLTLFGVLAHIAYGDEGGAEFEKQREVFSELKARVESLCARFGIPIPRFSSLSSSGALRTGAQSSALQDDLVRIGIAAYGYLEAPLAIATDLRPVASLWAHRICSKNLEQDSKIGYGGKGRVEAKGVVSTYDVGYGDGFFRFNEIHARNLQKCGEKFHTAEGYEIFPRMSMDCFSCASDAPKVCLMNDASYVARVFGTISYEILAHLSPNIARVVV